MDAQEHPDIELIDFAVSHMEELADQGVYWADEVDDEDRVYPRDVVAALHRAMDRLRALGEDEDGA